MGYNTDINFVTEKSGSVTFTIRVSSHPFTGAPRPFSLAVRTMDGTASMLYSPYNFNLFTLHFVFSRLL